MFDREGPLSKCPECGVKKINGLPSGGHFFVLASCARNTHMHILRCLIDLLKGRRRSAAALMPTATRNVAGPSKSTHDGAAKYPRQVVTRMIALAIHTT